MNPQIIAGKYFSVQYIVLYRDIHAYVYHKYSDTLILHANSLSQTVWTKMKTNRMSVLIWIQTVWHSDGGPGWFIF